MLHRPLLCFLLCWLLEHGVSAQAPLHVSTTFGMAEGLTEPVHKMVQDDVGFFWIATHNGLFRFDGVHATKIYLPVTDSLISRCNNVYDLCFDPVNQLIWFGTDGGLFYYGLRTGAIRHFHPKDYYSEKDREIQATHAVFADRKGQVWAEFGRYGLAHLSVNGELLGTYYLPLSEKEKATGFDEKMANTVLDISQDPVHDNTLWMNTRRGLLRFDKETEQLTRFLFYTENPKMLTPANSMTSHFAHPNGFVYIGTWNAGLLKFDPKSGQFNQFLRNGKAWEESTKNAYRITSLVPDRQGQIWTNGTDGTAIFDVQNEQFTPLPDTEIKVDFQDRDGNYWQFQNGLRMYHHLKNQGKWVAYSKDIPCEQLVGLLFDGRNREVFFRGFCGDGAFWVMNVDDHLNRSYPVPNRTGDRVFAGEWAESKSAYYLVEGQKLEIYQRREGNAGFEKIPVVFPVNSGNLNLASSPVGDLFVTGYTGWLFWLKPPDPLIGRNKWEMTTFSKSSLGGHLPEDLHCVSVPTFDANGNLWLKTCRGFSIFSTEKTKFRHFLTKEEGVKHLENYNAFVPDEQKMWASGKGGFGWFDIEKPEAGLQKTYKPKGNFSYEEFILEAIIQDRLWLKTSEGWVEFDPQKETYRYFDFLEATQLVQLGGGKLLAHEGDGFRLFQLDSLQVSEEIPKPYVSWFKVFERPMPMAIRLQSAPDLRLKPDQNFFSIGFSALATYNTTGIRFAYQLNGVNPEWVYPEPGVRAASFTNIEGGDYTFKIKTTNSRGEWLDNVYALKIHVGTPWYKTGWFRLSLSVLLCAFIYALVNNRLKQQAILLENQRLQLEQEQSLRKERDRIAAEMHDELGAGLSTIRFLSLAAKEKEKDPTNAARIDRISQNATQVMEKMADIIWVMNSRNDLLDNFAAYLRRYAGELLETHGILLSFELPPELPVIPLSSTQRRTLLLAVKECLHNVVKHSGATEARLALHTNGNLEIQVQDNGKGIPADYLAELGTGHPSHLGNGLRNIGQRMKDLGGEAIFESGVGAKVILRCPLVTV